LLGTHSHNAKSKQHLPKPKSIGGPCPSWFSSCFALLLFPLFVQRKTKKHKQNKWSFATPSGAQPFLHEMGDPPLSLLFSLSTTYVSLPTSHYSHANSQACLSLPWSMRNVIMARHPYSSDNCSLITRAAVPVVMLASALALKAHGKSSIMSINSSFLLARIKIASPSIFSIHTRFSLSLPNKLV